MQIYHINNNQIDNTKSSSETISNNSLLNSTTPSSLHSAELLLSIIQNEFKYEDDKNKVFQNRAGIFLSLDGVMLSLFFDKINLSKVVNIDILNFSNTILPYIYFLLLGIIFLCSIISLISFVLILATNADSRLDLNGFNDIGISSSSDTIAASIMKSYTSIVKENGETANVCLSL